MRGAVAEPQVPGLVRVTMLSTNELFGPARVVIGGVFLDPPCLTPIEGDELIVVIMGGIVGELGSVPDNLEVPVTPDSGICSGMPFPDLLGGITIRVVSGVRSRKQEVSEDCKSVGIPDTTLLENVQEPSAAASAGLPAYLLGREHLL